MLWSLITLHFTVGAIVALLYGLVGILPHIDMMQNDQDFRSKKLYTALVCFLLWEYLIIRGLRKQQ